MSDKTIKVMEWNMNCASNENREIPGFVLNEIINKEKPDICVLTEIVHCSKEVEDLKKNGYDARVSIHKENQNDVLIAWKIEEFEYKDIDEILNSSDENEEPDYLMVSLRVKKSKKIIHIVGMRIRTLGLDKRKSQMSKVFENINKLDQKDSVIILGDFNVNRRGFDGEWNINILEKISKEYKFSLFPTNGSSIFQAETYHDLEFPEDNVITKNCEAKNFLYDRSFTEENPNLYIAHKDFSVYSPKIRRPIWQIICGSGLPDHAILKGNIVIKGLDS